MFYEAAGISLRALQALIERYVALAQEMSGQADDPAWAAELAEIAAVCRQIAVGPARSFREALQLTWFTFLAVAVEAGVEHHCFGPGRLDQYLYPYYVADRAAGVLNEALVDALLDQLFIKCNEFEGLQSSAVIVGVAGRKPDGGDATNELSYKCLQASDRTRLYFPGVDVLGHSDIDEEFMRQACRLLGNMNGQPSFFNSDLIIKGLLRYGVPYEHAVDHLPSTCTETSIMGRSNPWVAWPYCNLPRCLLYALHGRDWLVPENELPPRPWADLLPPTDQRPATPAPQTYQELGAAFRQHVGFEAHRAIEFGNRCQLLASWYRPFPLLSCFIQGCLETGRDIAHGGALYNFLQPEAVGVPNVVDSLLAVKTLVAEQGRFTLDDFRAALQADFAGYEGPQRAILDDCPKHRP